MAAYKQYKITVPPGDWWYHNDTTTGSYTYPFTRPYSVTYTANTSSIVLNATTAASTATTWHPAGTAVGYEVDWLQEDWTYEDQIVVNPVVYQAAHTEPRDYVNPEAMANMAQYAQNLSDNMRAMQDRAQRQREERNRVVLERQRRWEQEEEERLLAHARALDLLHAVLTPAEILQMRDGFVTINGSDGYRYEISTVGGVHGNIARLDDHGCRLGSVCVAPRMQDQNGLVLPTPDGWVGQVLGLRFNAAEFLAVGNWSRRRECQHPDVPVLADRAA